MNTLLLIIDMQNDFCKKNGTLYVSGSEADVERLGKFISAYSGKINHIIMTQDNHNVIDISHPVFWEDDNGNPPPPFTEINSGNLQDGTWRPRFEPEKAVEYIRKLEEQGEFPHTVWPEHCIIGSYGAAIVDEIMEPVKAWARKGKFFDLIIKGTHPLTEHFGALIANVPVEGSPDTQLNMELVEKLRFYDRILVAGEARSHCVATTVRQMLDIEGLSHKLIVLDDCMSDVSGYETLAIPIYKKAKNDGVRFISTTALPDEIFV